MCGEVGDRRVALYRARIQMAPLSFIAHGGAALLFAVAAVAATRGASPAGQADLLVHRSVERTLYVTSPVVREEYIIMAQLSQKALVERASVPSYTIALPAALAAAVGQVSVSKNDAERTFIKVSPLDREACLAVTRTEAREGGAEPRCFSFDFPTPLSGAASSTSSFVFLLGISYTDRYRPWPARAVQDAPLVLHGVFPALWPTPYATGYQLTRVIVAKEMTLQSIDCPIPRKLQGFLTENARLPKAKEYTCGPYADGLPTSFAPLQPKEEGSAEAGQITVLFKAAHMPFIRINSLVRTLTVDVLRGTIGVVEEYEVASQSFLLEGDRFSRTDFVRSYMMDNGMKNVQMHPLFEASVPREATNVVVRDEVGLVTSQLLRRNNPLRAASSSLIGVQTRNCLLSDWSVSFALSYTLPAKPFMDMVYITDVRQYVHRLTMPLVELFNDVAIGTLTVNVVLPGNASMYGPDVSITGQINSPNIVRTRRHLEGPPFGLTRVQVHTLAITNAVKEHTVPMTVYFAYPIWTPYLSLLAYALVGALAVTAASLLGRLWPLLILSPPAKGADGRGAAFAAFKRAAKVSRLFHRRRTALLALDRILDDLYSAPEDKILLDGEDRAIVEEKVATIGALDKEAAALIAAVADGAGSLRQAAVLEAKYAEQLARIRAALSRQVLGGSAGSLVALDGEVISAEASLLVQLSP